MRERIELLLDRDAPFMELSALAAWGTEFNVGAAIVTGVGIAGERRYLIAQRVDDALWENLGRQDQPPS